MELESFKIRCETIYKNQDDLNFTKEKINNQQNICYICCCDLDLNDKEETIIKTKCNHYYHYDCLLSCIINLNKSWSKNKQESFESFERRYLL